MRKYIIALTILAISTGLSAQKDHRKEEFKALQIAYITDKLELTPEESQQFWPIHNQFEKKGKEIKSQFRRSENEVATEDEALKYIDARLKAEQQMVDLKRVYVQDLKQVLSAQKIAMLFEIEHDFKRKMLKNIRDRRKEER